VIRDRRPTARAREIAWPRINALKIRWEGQIFKDLEIQAVDVLLNDETSIASMSLTPNLICRSVTVVLHT